MSKTHSEPTEHEIAVCAYCIWEQEGRPKGRALAHWLQAKTQIAASNLPKKANANGPNKRKRHKEA